MSAPVPDIRSPEWNVTKCNEDGSYTLSITYQVYSTTELRLMAYFYKWKNHFVEMKGDVGMSVHEKEGKQVNATPTHKTIYNPIPTSL